MEYGTRLDLLPDFVRTASSSGSARLLDLAENQRIEALSLNRFSHMSSDRIDWTGVSGIEQLVYMDEKSGAQLLRDLLSRLTKANRVVVFWGNLIIPTVSLSVDLVIAHADEVLGVGPQFWVFAAEDDTLIEFLQDGQVTVASVAE